MLDEVPLTSTSPRQRLATGRASAYLALTKPRIVELLLVTTVPTMILAQRGLPSLWLMGFTVVGGSLAAGGANALNMVYDRDIDAVMGRTAGRPLVTGALTTRQAATFAILLEVAAFGLLWAEADLLAAALALAAAAFYLGVYTMVLKRSTSQNIVIGGAAGAVPVLVGWAAVTGRLSASSWLLFAIIFLWTPPHFWALAVKYREDYSRADVPMLPSIGSLERTANSILAYTVALFAVSLALVPIAHLGAVYLVVAVAAGASFMFRAWTFRRAPTPARAMRLFAYSIAYLTVIFVGIGVDTLLHAPLP
jgi:protoheme IX farnesyltransferase